MRWPAWTLFGVVGLLLGAAWVAALTVQVPDQGAAAWDDRGPTGHSRLVDALAQDHEVRVIETSVGVLDDPGPDAVLFLFPTHRHPTGTEVEALRSFVDGGGHAVLAADGDHARAWAHGLGARFTDIPVVTPPGEEVACIEVEAQAEAMPCLPSPSSFPDLERDQSVSVVRNSTTPVFLDTDLDGTLSRGDRGPGPVPMFAQWHHGEGTLSAIPDGDLWRNGVVQDHDQNLDFAQELADGGAVYIDSTSGPASALDLAAWMAYHAFVGDPWTTSMFTLVLTGVVAAATRIPRAQPFPRHVGLREAGDAELEARAIALLQKQAASDDPQEAGGPRT